MELSRYILPPPTEYGCSNTNHLSICSYKLKCTINLCCALRFTCSMLSSNKICASPSCCTSVNLGYLLCLHQHRLGSFASVKIGILSSISKLVAVNSCCTFNNQVTCNTYFTYTCTCVKSGFRYLGTFTVKSPFGTLTNFGHYNSLNVVGYSPYNVFIMR